MSTGSEVQIIQSKMNYGRDTLSNIEFELFMHYRIYYVLDIN